MKLFRKKDGNPDKKGKLHKYLPVTAFAFAGAFCLRLSHTITSESRQDALILSIFFFLAAGYILIRGILKR